MRRWEINITFVSSQGTKMPCRQWFATSCLLSASPMWFSLPRCSHSTMCNGWAKFLHSPHVVHYNQHHYNPVLLLQSAFLAQEGAISDDTVNLSSFFLFIDLATSEETGHDLIFSAICLRRSFKIIGRRRHNWTEILLLKYCVKMQF
jgi:hypothetical protein